MLREEKEIEEIVALSKSKTDEARTSLIQKLTMIDAKQRSVLWIRTSGAEKVKNDADLTYENLVHKAEDENVIEEDVLIQIRKDINRSGIEDKKNIEVLERILTAYAVRNRDVGYAQGMNFLVARCLNLNVFKEEDIFWILAVLVERILKDYFNESLTGVMVDCKVCSELLKSYRPRLYDMLQKHDIEITGEVSSMLMTMFDNNLPSNSVCIVWDLIFLLSFERFAFAVLMMYFQNCEIFAPERLLQDDKEESSKSLLESSSSSSLFEGHGAGFGLEMLLMQTMRKWRTLPEKDVIHNVIRPALCLTLPSANAIEDMRRKLRSDVRMKLALDRNPKLKILYSQAQTLRYELNRQRMMLNRPLLSSSGTAINARREMRRIVIEIINMIEKRFPDLDAFSSRRESNDRLRRRASSFNSVLSDDFVIVNNEGQRKKIVFLSEDALLLHVAKGFGKINLPVELSKSAPDVAIRVVKLEQTLRNAASKAEPVSQLCHHIFAEFSVNVQIKDFVRCLLIVERWIMEKPLWRHVPLAYRAEMTRELKTISIVLYNVIRQKIPCYFSKIESGILYALRSWSNSTKDCYLFTSPDDDDDDDDDDNDTKTKKSSMRTQLFALHAHARLVRRVEPIVAPIRKDALRGVKELLSVLLRDHERKMMTASYTNCALRCLESVKSILSSSAKFDTTSAMYLIAQAKNYSHAIPDTQWRNALMQEAEKFSFLLKKRCADC